MRADHDDRATWDAVAEFWHQRMGEGNDFVERLIWPCVRKLLPPLKGSRILDIGCGNGLYARKLATEGASVVAVDYSPAMIAQARAAGEYGIEYAVVDASDPTSLGSLPGGEFDSVLATMVLMNMSSLDPLFRSIRRLAAPGGSFVFATAHPCFNSPHAALNVGASASGEVRVTSYQTPSRTRGEAIRGQPSETPSYHRPLAELLRPAFESGMALDALEEPSFPAAHPRGSRPDSWSGQFSEFPAVLIGRLRPAG